ncbi:hypothetical protein [Mycobacteroides franklinii]|uniref:hypothetical protein n=1 Tax=Mycobacteroides franklinii TaxID=948102 RepID=UPI0013E8CE0D
MPTFLSGWFAAATQRRTHITDELDGLQPMLGGLLRFAEGVAGLKCVVQVGE